MPPFEIIAAEQESSRDHARVCRESERAEIVIRSLSQGPQANIKDTVIQVGPLFTRDAGDLMHFTIITVIASLPGPVSHHELNYFVLARFGFWRLEEDVEPVDPQFFVARNEGEHIAAEPDA